MRQSVANLQLLFWPVAVKTLLPDGVERNALATHRGWGTVIVSSLSLLGVLGSVKSSVKLALGLELTDSAGFNLDSLRSMFGYLPGESSRSRPIAECDSITLEIFPDRVVVRKDKQYYTRSETTIVGVGDHPPLYSTLVDLGNLTGEASFWQNPFLVAMVLFLCSGSTAWLLLIITAPWTWF